MNKLATLYRHRFNDAELTNKYKIWRVLCRDFFQNYVDRDDVILDLGCGYGEFLNNIEAGKKHGIDLNPDTPRFLRSDIEFHAVPATDLGPVIGDDAIDIVFTSNFLEHLPDKATLSQVFAEVYRVLRPGGRFLALGPNIRCVGGAYWDFFDHHLPLTDAAIAEGLAISGFDVDLVIDRFLPYTTKSALPQHPRLVQAYLKVPLMWKLLGGQFFVVGRKPEL
ncbi:MAG: class I SAM-dependent methyltransferase [Thiohalocapsa sp.]